MPENGVPPSPEGSPLPEKKLVSWKEIAAHLGREVRTVQRWETTEGLPVKRHEHQKKSTVYAYPSELDEWVKKRQPVDDPEADAAFAREQELSGTDSPIDSVDPLAVLPAPVDSSRIAPAPDPVKPPPLPIWKRVVIAAASLAIFSAASFAIYRWTQPKNLAYEKVRIVVLPFNYTSGDSKPDYITVGLADVIRTKLGQLDPPHLGVIAATSSRIVAKQAIPDIGRTLNVKYVLEGSVQRAGNQVRIDVQLIQVSDETHLWADSFTRELSDVLQVESDVSAAIARQILATLPVPPSQQPPASLRSGTVHASTPEIANSRHAYHQGKFAYGSRGDLRGSIVFFEQAIHDDPSYAEAYAGLAQATAILGQAPNDGIPPREAKPKARDFAQRALQLNPRLAEAHAVLGNMAMSYDWDLPTAERELRRAIELNANDPTPHEWYCHLLIVEGRNAEALTEARQALDLDPVNPLFHTVLAETYYYGREYDAAIDEAQQVVRLHPDFPLAQYWLGSAYREKKMYPQAKARAALRKLEQLAGTRFVPNLYPAAIHVGLGENDEAFRLLDLAYQERIDRLVYLNVDPMADPIRSDPRFAQLMAKIGLH